MARRPRKYFKASEWELEDAEEEQVEIIINHAPKDFVVGVPVWTNNGFSRYAVNITFGVFLDLDNQAVELRLRGQRQGLDYIVTGGGGAELRPLKCDPRRRRCKNQPQYFANEHHYLRLEVLPTVLRVCPRRPDGTALEECQVLRLRRP